MYFLQYYGLEGGEGRTGWKERKERLMESLESSLPHEKVFTIRKINRFIKSQHLFKVNFILLVNTQLPTSMPIFGCAQNHFE